MTQAYAAVAGLAGPNIVRCIDDNAVTAIATVDFADLDALPGGQQAGGAAVRATRKRSDEKFVTAWRIIIR